MAEYSGRKEDKVILVCELYISICIDLETLCALQVEPDGEFLVEPLRILDRREIELRKRVVVQVKVQWKHFGVDEATWEEEKFVREAYPELFPERG